MIAVLVPTALPRFASQYANLCGVRHHIRDTGDITPDGPVAVLLHGLGRGLRGALSRALGPRQGPRRFGGAGAIAEETTGQGAGVFR